MKLLCTCERTSGWQYYVIIYGTILCDVSSIELIEDPESLLIGFNSFVALRNYLAALLPEDRYDAKRRVAKLPGVSAAPVSPFVSIV